MDLLARREHSAFELATKLARHFSKLHIRKKRASTHNSSRSEDLNIHVPSSSTTQLESSRSSTASHELEEQSADELDALIHNQIALLAEENLQSDERFVESFINGRKSQGKGPLRIRRELEQKQIAAGIVANYLFDDDEQWALLAEEVYVKKYGRQSVNSYQERSKRLRFMVYRGFHQNLVYPLFSCDD